MHHRAGERAGDAVELLHLGHHELATAVLALTIVFGILTTGSGPHSGDAAAGRNGFDSELLEHVHAWPGYALFALTLALLVAAWQLKLPTLGWVGVLLAVEVVQIAVGLYQARNGLPPIAVGVHMVLAALTAATMTVVVLLVPPVQVATPAPPEANMPFASIFTVCVWYSTSRLPG